VHTGRPGFAIADSQGKWSGLDVDFCRAIAAAVLKDEAKVRYVPTSAQTRITALQSGELDLLSRNTTWTLTRDTSLGLSWVGINFYDGQAFIARKSPKLKGVKDLNGSTICLESGTTTEKNVAEYFKANKISYKGIIFDSNEAALQALGSGRCQVYSADYTALAIMQAKQLKEPENFVILPEIISKEPVGPAVRRGDDEWAAVVKWVLYAMVEAEELGINKANVDSLKANSQDPSVRRFLGVSEDMGKLMGLDREWAFRIVKQVGNYGESYETNLGKDSPLKLKRNLNNLWNKGGLMYAPPVR
jgi:general L-amino acid transport system substrate-binding protein